MPPAPIRSQKGPKSYANQAEFSKVLADSPQPHSCYATDWAADLYARIPRAGDVRRRRGGTELAQPEHLSADLIVALMTNDAFVTRVEGP